MFENLKKKLKKAISGISKKIEEPEPEAIEEEIIEDAQAEEVVKEVIEESEKAEALEPVEDEVHEEEVEEIIKETLAEKVPEPEIKLEKETEKTEELEKELVEDEQAEEEVKEILKEIVEKPKTKEEEKLEEKTEKVIKKVLEKEPKKKEVEAARKELKTMVDLSEEETRILQEAEQEAEAEFKKHKEVLEKEGEGFFKKLFKKEEKPKPRPEKPRATLMERLRNKKLSEKDLDKILWELELALLENDVAKEVTEKITGDVKNELVGSETSRKSVAVLITDALKMSVEGILRKEQPDIIQKIKNKTEKPYVILFFGFNGTGKTLSIGKFAKLLKDNGLSCVMAAGDTFRAAAIEQLEIHANKLDVSMIKQERGSDSAAVIYDAVEHAKAKGIDVVLADTAGRSNTNINLMDELKKVVRVNNPDLKVFVGDALTGNDAADQAKVFHDAVGIDVSVLTKVDCDAKGGACLSVSYVTDAPIVYLGTGQDYGDMEPFEPEWFLDKVF